MNSHWKKALLAASIVGLSAGVAVAVPARVVTDSNLRKGPGTNFPIEAVIPAGAIIEILDCSGNWCAAVAGPDRGYIARSLVAFAGGGAAFAAAPESESYEYNPEYYAYGPEYYAYGPDYYYSPGISFSFESGRGHHRRHHGDRDFDKSKHHRGDWKNESHRDRGGERVHSERNNKRIEMHQQNQPRANVEGRGRGDERVHFERGNQRPRVEMHRQNVQPRANAERRGDHSNRGGQSNRGSSHDRRG